MILIDCCVELADGGMSRWKCLSILRPGWVEILRLLIKASAAHELVGEVIGLGASQIPLFDCRRLASN